MRRIRHAIERHGMSAVMDQRGGRPRRKRVMAQTLREICRLKCRMYADFSMRHFYERLTEQTGSGCHIPMSGRCCRRPGLWRRSPAVAATGVGVNARGWEC